MTPAPFTAFLVLGFIVAMTPEHITSILSIVGGAVTGYFLWLNTRKQDQNQRQQDNNHIVLTKKVEENTAENREQIRTGNHVNEKLLSTNELAVAANKVAVVSMQDVMHALSVNRADIAELKGMLLMRDVLHHPATPPENPADRHFAQVRTIQADTPSLQTPANGD